MYIITLTSVEECQYKTVTGTNTHDTISESYSYQVCLRSVWLVGFWRQGLAMLCKLLLNSLCSPGWHPTLSDPPPSASLASWDYRHAPPKHMGLFLKILQ